MALPWGILFLVLGGALPILALDPVQGESARAGLRWAQGLLLLGGLGLLQVRRFEKAALFPPALHRALVALVTVAYVVVACEIGSYLLLFHAIPAARWVAVLNTLDASRTPPRFVPYLWSNYAPNPSSPEVNRWGWRYGGGPKVKRQRLLVIGGSTVWSDGAATAETSYPAQLERALQAKGWDVEVVNAGVPAHTSAETLGLFQFRGLSEKPDFVLFHVENDVAAALSPGPYRPDYSHWRAAGRTLSNENQLFRHLWRFPSWTTRFALVGILRPDGNDASTVGEELTSPGEILFAPTEVARPEGLERNLRSLVAMARAHGVVPLLASFDFAVDHPKSIVKLLGKSPAEVARATVRWKAAIAGSNAALRRVALQTGTVLLPVAEFHPSSIDRLRDHCHLDERGNGELAEFVAVSLAGVGHFTQSSKKSSPAISFP